VGYETFHELEFAHENELPLFPIRLCEQWPPAPQNNERGTCQNKFVFKKSLVFAEDRQMTNARGVADQIAESVARMGIFRNYAQLNTPGVNTPGKINADCWSCPSLPWLHFFTWFG